MGSCWVRQTASIPYLNPGDRAAHVAVLVGGPFRNQHVLPWRGLRLAEFNPAVMAALLAMARRDGRAAVHAGIGEADAFGWFGHLGAASFDFFGLLGVDFHEVAAGLLVREQSRDFSPFSALAINASVLPYTIFGPDPVQPHWFG